MKLKHWLVFLLLGGIWSSSFLWIKIAVQEVGPTTLVAFRVLFGLLFGLIVVAIQRPRLPRSWREWFPVLLLGVTNVAIPFFLISWGEQAIDSAVAAILDATVPLFTIVIAHIWLHDDRITFHKTLGLLVGFAGVVVLMSKDIGSTIGPLLGQGAVILASAFYAGSSVYARRTTENVPGILRSVGPLISSTVLMWLATVTVERPVHIPQLPITWVALVWLGVLGSGFAFILNYYLIHEIGPTRTTMVTYLFPLGGVILGVSFLGEQLSWQLIAGAALIIASLAVANYQPRQPSAVEVGTTETVDEFHSGVIAVVGRPNAGKSTLINALVGQKVAAVSPRPQTTRRRQLGILTLPNAQLVFMDTPGIHTAKHKLGEFLNQEAEEALRGIDAVVWIVDAASEPGEEDRHIAALLKALPARVPQVLAANKMDLLATGQRQPAAEAYKSQMRPDAQSVIISALKSEGLQDLIALLITLLPERPAEFEEDQITDLYEKEIASDLIREAALLKLRDEVPHGIAVRIDQYTERPNGMSYIEATIFVERESQKGIVIGEGGKMLKQIGSKAREQIEEMAGHQVYLQLRVKVEKDWRNNENVLRRLGYKLKK